MFANNFGGSTKVLNNNFGGQNFGGHILGGPKHGTECVRYGKVRPPFRVYYRVRHANITDLSETG